MKILYVNPSRLESGLDSIIKQVPLNLISIAAMVPDHEAKLFDYKVDNYNEKRFRNELNRCDVVAITSMTPQIYYAFEVAEMAKEQGCTTILGGYHPTLAPDHVASHPDVDYTIRGEGEHTFREIIDFLDGNQKHISLKNIDGVSYKNKDGKIVHNNDRQLEPNLDNFPMPRRELLRGKSYTHMGTRMDNIETSRGCPHSCKFCCIIKMWKDSSQHISYRTKSLRRIMREIYNIDRRNNFVFFCEDNFTINVKRTNKILDTIIRAGIPNKLYFSCQSRIDTLYRNPWLIKKMHEAGFRQVFLGIESVNQQSLDAMNKRNTTPLMAEQVVKMLQNEGISIFGGIILGFPGETKEMVYNTIQFAKSLDMAIVQFTPITAFPGTDFYNDMKAKGMITSNNFKHYDLFHTMLRTDQLSNVELYHLVAEAYASYYLDGDWIKARAKQYLNPFGKFNWMLPYIFRLGQQGIKGGWGMLHTQGIQSSIVSNQLKNLIKIPKIKSKQTALELNSKIHNNTLIPTNQEKKLKVSTEY